MKPEPYDIESERGVERALYKLRKRNILMYNAVVKKILHIARNPYVGKPIRNVLRGKRRVHIGNFVLTYRINEESRKVILLKFAHHDEVYR